jgi:DNA-binding NarL/FixJ family response regulator
MKVFIIDDHTLFRESLANMLDSYPDLEILGGASSGLEGISRIEELHPDIIIIDISLTDISGFEVAKSIITTCLNPRIVFLTASENEKDLKMASFLGAKGYFLKNISPDYFVSCLRDIFNGGSRISPDLAGNIFNTLKGTHNPIALKTDVVNKGILSVREIEVLMKLHDGLNNKEIAKALFITENTVKNHLKNIFAKFGVQNRLQAVTKGIEQHIIPLKSGDQEKKCSDMWDYW